MFGARRRALVGFFLALLLPAPALGDATKPADDDTSALVGRPLPEWTVDGWYNSGPLTPADLRGKVVLLRWLTSPTCPRCLATAATLRQLWEDFQAEGLLVIGMYHHHSVLPVEPEVRRTIEQYRFRFPVAVDPYWQTIKRWWLEGRNRTTSSISVLVDRAGIVRYVHPGGTIAPDSCDSVNLRNRVKQLLAQSPAHSASHSGRRELSSKTSLPPR
jgi:peroxiredoxin